MLSVKTIKPNLRKRMILHVNKHFQNGYEALESLGYKRLEYSEHYEGNYYKVFEKNGEEYI